jgi:hypothetical protein
VATTGADGVAAFSLTNAPSGTYVTGVTQVLADGYDWTPTSMTWEYTK